MKLTLIFMLCAAIFKTQFMMSGINLKKQGVDNMKGTEHANKSNLAINFRVVLIRKLPMPSDQSTKNEQTPLPSFQPQQVPFSQRVHMIKTQRTQNPE